MRAWTRRTGTSEPMAPATEPLSLVESLRRGLDRILQEAETLLPGIPLLGTSAGMPTVDIRDEPAEFLVTADVPGLTPEAIDVRIQDRTLTISGERSQSEEEKAATYHRRERLAGVFSRSFVLPSDVDADGIKAKFKNGLLTIAIPKVHPTAAKEVPVETET